MIRTTRAQREAIFRIFRRDFPGWISPSKRIADHRKFDSLPYSFDALQTFANRHPDVIVPVPSIQYRRFRKRVQGGYGCLMLQWHGMWLGIEPDGYTHS